MKHVTIKRSEWHRGSSSKGSAMLLSNDKASNGKRCCLGFVARECGLADDDIRNIPMPSSLSGHDVELPSAMKWLVERVWPRNNGLEQWENRVAEINDDDMIDDARREELLTPIFREHDIEPEFVD